MLLAAVPVLLLALWRRREEFRRLTAGDRLSILLAGLCLAAHFGTWVASLKFGTVASSVALVTTSPLFVAGFAFMFARERTSHRTMVAIGICTIGGIVIASADARAGGAWWWGDGLALAGAVFAAAYYAFGRRARSAVSALTYIGGVYPMAAIALATVAIATRQPMTGFSPATLAIFAALALVPQLLGHSALNWALGYLSAPSVAIAVLGEPVIATLLAWIFLHEQPGWQRIVGGALILLGVYASLREERLRLSVPAALSLSSEASA
jgi:drug/metabolite transporter (DMT)-like permease